MLELHQHPEVCKEIADLVAHFHKQCVDAFRTGESSRQQRIPVTFDDMAATAAHALAQGVGAMLRPRLLAQARDTSLSWGARKYAVQALGRKTTAEEQTVLVTFLDSSDPTASLDAAAALAEAETCFVRPRLVKLIEAQLSSSNPLSAMSAVIALGRVRTVEERILILKSLGHSFSVVRQGAAETLLRSGSDALDSSLYLSKVQEVVLAAVKEGISREVELAGALNSLFTEAGIA